MELALLVLAGWSLLSLVALVGAAAVCRGGHVEDVARGFADSGPVQVPSPREPEVAAEVTHR